MQNPHVGAALFFAVFAPAVANAGTPCDRIQCNRGATVVTYATPSDGYFVCPSRQLSEYTHLVLGLVSLHQQTTGTTPVFSQETGEPKYEGETEAMLKKYRAAAGVRTFQEAKGKCSNGPDGQRVQVEENPPDSVALMVSDRSGQRFWVPKVHVDKP
jgi:hypothetical protein